MQRLLTILILVGIIACEADKEELRKNLPAKTVDSMAVESFGVKLIFSDSANVTAELYASHVMEIQDKMFLEEEELEKFKKHIALAVDRVMSTDKEAENITALIMQEAVRSFPRPEKNDDEKEEDEEKKKKAMRNPVVNNQVRVFHYMEDSIHVDFLDRNGIPHSFVESESAIYSRDEDWAILIENVILKSSEGDRLETQQLFWDKTIDSIYTHTPVKITTPDKIITGSGGMRSTTTFDSYVIYGTYGEVNLNSVEDEKPKPAKPSYRPQLPK